MTKIDFEYLYKNREEAYSELFKKIPEIEYDKDWKILTTTVNNIKEIDSISKKLDLPYDVFFLKEITAPKNSECVIASVSELKDIVLEKNLIKSFEIDEDYVYQKSQEIYEDSLIKKIHAFKNGKVLDNIEGKNFLIFSDGCDIGLNLMCTVKSLLNAKAKKIFLFLPVISSDLYYSLDMIVDEIFTNHKIEDFIRTSYYFEDFSDLDMEMIQYILTKEKY